MAGNGEGDPLVDKSANNQQGTTRQAIVSLLKTRGAQHTGDLAQALGITEMGVRRHLSSLEREGFIEQRAVRQPMGRPVHMFQLTPQAEQLFPSNYNRLALDLLDELARDEHTTGLINKLFEARRNKMLDSYQVRMEGKSLPERAAELAAIQDASGYMARLEAGAEDEMLLHEHHCPIAQVAGRYQHACRCELELFQSLLGAEAAVERTECLAKGGGKCTYRITKHKHAT